MTNPRADRVRDVAKLATRAARNRRRQFLAEGPQAVREALRLDADRRAEGGAPIVVELYASESCLSRHPEIAHLAEATGRLRLADDDVLAAMADTVNPQGIVSVCTMLDVPLSAVLAEQPRLLAVMCRVQDPGNAGTILRAADSAGASAVVLTAGSVDIYNPKAVRSTAGSIFHVPVVIGVDPAAFAAEARGAGLKILAADGAGPLDLDGLQDASAARRAGGEGTAGDYRLEDPTAWLFGNEAQGLSQAEKDLADHRVAVPLYGRAESLNVGTAATVCLYASARSQRR
ncbi:RNA methyltransferase [Sinomonas atrocyanea]|uniref:RNA methyltransferase n=1 Tax=Sinomonas atrocyanea TaxID=37927 RepID=A0A126ZZT7_9MICC|nr:RNA methyltransferase [Sinomonas atrocyanea]AMM32386.1 RNA methyltransferase [Sinomonas atrocyanea]GEB63913.1 RNA methyltransferase [Sinomonas atrocyanea]GGG66907.1 RNA methyltransferase [Sinomonas atrocyanea]